MELARSLYKKDVDFEALALQCRDFAKQYVKLSVVYSMLLIRIVTSLKPNKQLDFTDPAAVR